VSALGRAGWVVRGVGLVLIVLGVLIWVGVASAIVPIHMLLGIVLVLALWATAYLALQAGAKPVLPAIAAAWGLVVVVLGLSQGFILPDTGHVLIQVAHLVVGIVAIGLAEALVAAGQRGSAATA